MTKLSLVASRTLVSFGVVALASTSSLGVDVEVTNKADPAKSNIASAEVGIDKDITTPEGTGFFTKTGNTIKRHFISKYFEIK